MPLSKQQWTEQAVIQSIGNELWCNCPFFGLLKLGLYDKKRFLWGLPSGNGYGDSRGRSDGSVLSVDPLRGLELLAVVLPISNHCCLLDLMDTPFSNPPFPGAAFLTGPFPTPKGVVIEVCKGRGEREGQREGGGEPRREGKREGGEERERERGPGKQISMLESLLALPIFHHWGAGHRPGERTEVTGSLVCSRALVVWGLSSSKP